MNFTFFQKICIENNLDINQSLVFSLLKSFKNFLSFDEIVHNLPIIQDYYIFSSLYDLQEKALIETSIVKGVLCYKIKK